MPDFKEPEEFDSGEHNQSEKEEIALKKEMIAQAFLLGYISDDNPSYKNGYTAFEQLIAFEFDVIDKREVVIDVYEIKREIISIAKSLEYFEHESGKNKIDEKAVNVKIAKYIEMGYLTDDAVSDWVGNTSLEQIIYFKYGFIDHKKFLWVKKQIISEELNLRGGSVLPRQEDIENDYFPYDSY